MIRSKKKPREYVAIVETIRSLLGKSGSVVTTDAPELVWINPIQKRNMLIIHLVNYDYDAGTDTAVAKRNIAVSVRLPAEKKLASNTVNVYSPDIRDTVVSAGRKGKRAEFIVPELSVWAVAVLQLE